MRASGEGYLLVDYVDLRDSYFSDLCVVGQRRGVGFELEESFSVGV